MVDVWLDGMNVGMHLGWISGYPFQEINMKSSRLFLYSRHFLLVAYLLSFAKFENLTLQHGPHSEVDEIDAYSNSQPPALRSPSSHKIWKWLPLERTPFQFEPIAIASYGTREAEREVKVNERLFA